VRWAKNEILYQRVNCFSSVKKRMTVRTLLNVGSTHGALVLYKNGFSLPDLGCAEANPSMAGVIVAVNRHVCLSLGMAWNRCVNSGVNVGERSRSASSST
jgi:hypothetical protein